MAELGHFCPLARLKTASAFDPASEIDQNRGLGPILARTGSQCVWWLGSLLMISLTAASIRRAQPTAPSGFRSPVEPRSASYTARIGAGLSGPPW